MSYVGVNSHLTNSYKNHGKVLESMQASQIGRGIIVGFGFRIATGFI